MLCRPMLFINESWGRATDMDRFQGTGKSFWDYFEVRDALPGSPEVRTAFKAMPLLRTAGMPIELPALVQPFI